MNLVSNIVRTERGLTIAGTRITLYDVMDYLTNHYPSKFIRSMLDLTQAQIDGALNYIEAHREEVEAEYDLVLKDAEELKQHYELENRDRIVRILIKQPQPGTEAIRSKLQAERAKLELQA